MSEIKMLRIWINRVVAFLLGALLIFIILQMTVVIDLSGKITYLEKELDDIQYEPGRLLAKGQTFFDNNDYTNAMQTLTKLFEQHPGSEEAVKGRTLYDQIKKTQDEMDKKWAAALPAIRAEWEMATIKKLKEDLNLKYQKESVDLENNMKSKIEKEWASAQYELRRIWEAGI